MIRILGKLQIFAVISVILTGVSACGGGGSAEEDNTVDEVTIINNVPVANDDIAVSTNGNLTVIDVLDNDIDSDGESLTIFAITSSPTHGTAAITSNGTAIEYTPNEGYLGLDSLTYSVSDGSLVDGIDNAIEPISIATVELTVNQTITLSGYVSNFLAAGSHVIATVGNSDFETTTNEDGSYSVEITSSEFDEMISVRAYGNATNNQEYIELVSIIEDFSGLIEADDGDNTLTASELHALNLTQLSTALFLVAKDANADQSFTSFTDYEAMVEQVDIDDVLQVTGMITLLIDNSSYNELLNENILTLLDDAAGQLTVLAIEDLSQKAALNGVDETVFSTSIESAIEESLDTPNMTPPLTPDMLVNKRIVQTESVRIGWMPPHGRVMDFEEDGTFTLYSYNNTWVNDIPVITTGTWFINDSRVEMVYSDRLEVEYVTYAVPEIFDEKYGEEIASAFENTESYFFLLNAKSSESKREFHLIVQTNNTMKVRLDTSVEEFIEFPYRVAEALNGRFGASYVNELSKGYDLTINPTTQLTTLTDENIEGDWVLFMPPPFVPESFTDVTGETTLFGNILPAFDEKVTLHTDGTVSTLFTSTVFNWSFDAGKIILTSYNNRLEYAPYYQVNKEWLTVIEHYKNDQLIDVYVDKIAQFDDSYSLFTDNVTTELPMAYTTNFNSHSNLSWQGDLRTPESVFGFHFNENGSAIYGIKVDEDEENSFFTGNTLNWNWSASGRQVVLDNNDSFFNFHKRYIEIVSVDSLGRVLVFEYSIIEYPLSEDSTTRTINIPPRLNILTLENLEHWPSAWENNNF